MVSQSAASIAAVTVTIVEAVTATVNTTVASTVTATTGAYSATVTTTVTTVHDVTTTTAARIGTGVEGLARKVTTADATWLSNWLRGCFRKWLRSCFRFWFRDWAGVCVPNLYQQY